MTQPDDMLRVLAELAPDRATTELDVARDSREFVWLGAHGTDLFAGDRGRVGSTLPALGGARDRVISHLSALDRLQRGERLIRQGWVTLVGRAVINGDEQQVCLPLLSQAVTLIGRSSGSARVIGDRVVLSLIDDPDDRAELEMSADFATNPRDPVVTGWIHDVVATAGLGTVDVFGPEVDPLDLRGRSTLSAVVGSSLHVARRTERASLEPELREWMSLGAGDATAFARLVRAVEQGSAATLDEAVPDGVAVAPDETILPLTASQRSVLESTRSRTLTTLTGAPGTGKSHTAVAAVIDAVSRGETVLLATASHHGVTAAVELLDEHDGPKPVVFGSSEDRDLTSEDLIELVSDPIPETEARRLVDEATDLFAKSRRVRAGIATKLAAESRFADIAARHGELVESAGRLPALADGSTDPAELLAELDRAESDGGRFAARRRNRAVERVHRACGTDPATDLGELRRSLTAAAELATLRRDQQAGGLSLDDSWAELLEATETARRSRAAAIDGATRSRGSADNEARGVVHDVAVALRSARGERRRVLHEIGGMALVRALPLWLGSVDDIDEILPAIPGMFDLVVIDQAEQIDQLRSAGSLLRARRALVVGDPVQADPALLGHDNSGADSQDGPAGLTTFDLADSATRPITLDVAFRGPVRTHVDRIAGRRGDDGVNQAEVDAVVDRLAQIIDAGERSIGIVTTQQPQAVAIGTAIVDRFGVDLLDRVELRVSTVDGFRHATSEVVIASLVDHDTTQTDDPALDGPRTIEMLITRARRRLLVVTSHSSPETVQSDISEAFRFLYRSDDRTPTPAPWANQVGSLVKDRAVQHGLAFGEWTIDLTVGDDDERLVAVAAAPHVNGTDAHIERFLALDRAGWRQADLFASRWLHRPAEAADHLVTISDPSSWPQR